MGRLLLFSICSPVGERHQLGAKSSTGLPSGSFLLLLLLECSFFSTLPRSSPPQKRLVSTPQSLLSKTYCKNVSAQLQQGANRLVKELLKCIYPEVLAFYNLKYYKVRNLLYKHRNKCYKQINRYSKYIKDKSLKLLTSQWLLLFS